MKGSSFDPQFKSANFGYRDQAFKVKNTQKFQSLVNPFSNFIIDENLHISRFLFPAHQTPNLEHKL